MNSGENREIINAISELKSEVAVLREKGIEVVDIPPRIRKHNYTEDTKKRKEEEK